MRKDPEDSDSLSRNFWLSSRRQGPQSCLIQTSLRSRFGLSVLGGPRRRRGIDQQSPGSGCVDVAKRVSYTYK